MMDFKKELEKFKPCLDVDKALEKNVNINEVEDLMDILKTMYAPRKGEKA